MRIPALDRLRAAALVLMLVHHFTKWLTGAPRRVLPGWEGFALTDVAAPAFTVAAGASAVLWATRRPTSPRTVIRRYGLLIPTGMALQWLFTSGVPFDWGVLQALGLGVVVSTLTVLALRPRFASPAPGAGSTGRRLAAWVGALGAAALVVGPVVERAVVDVEGRPGEVLGGTFPAITYVGLALLGAAAGLLLRDRPDRGRQALLAGAGLAAVAAVLALAGDPPDRYPGDVSFLVPGLAGTLLLYGALDRWPMPAAFGNHTLGIFIAHYGVSWLLTAGDLRGALDPAPALAVSMAAVAAFAAVAPRVPTLPWSPRTGWAQKRRASSAAYRATTASVPAVASTASTTSARRPAGIAHV